MKTLQNHFIFFDNECPMCALYTKAFVKLDFLDQDARLAYQEMPQELCPVIDQQRAANEIALIDTKTGTVTYGIESIFKIIAHRLPIFAPVFRFRPFAWLMAKLYAFISYNRKVIIPAHANPTSIQPSFKLHYRILYLIFAWVITAYLLTIYARKLTDFVPFGNPYREYVICGSQILFQGLVILFYKKKTFWAYLGNMMTISLAGALAFIPILILSKMMDIASIYFLLYFLMIAGAMFLEHLRRSKILGLGWLPSLTWISYRLIVLALILTLSHEI